MIAAWLARVGLGWLWGPIGKALLIVAGALLVVHLIRQDALADCAADQLAAEIELERERTVAAQKIANEARARADQSEERIAQLEELTDDLISETTDACPVSDDLRERLRSIE